MPEAGFEPVVLFHLTLCKLTRGNCPREGQVFMAIMLTGATDHRNLLADWSCNTDR